MRFLPLVLLVLAGLLGGSSSLAATWSFPRATPSPYGPPPSLKSQQALNHDVQHHFMTWRSTFLTQQGAPPGTWRVKRDAEYGEDTVSEGIGYGMLILALMENGRNQTQAQFDGLWRYHRQYRNVRGLMHWRIDAKGRVIGKDSATDAEEDVAAALLIAHKQWGSSPAAPYLDDAKELIGRIMAYQVEAGTFILKPGDVWGGSDTTNPSSYAPAYWRMYYAVTGDPRWLEVIRANYAVIDRILAASPDGLAPDWCNAQGRKAAEPFGYDYRYDAARVPWRLGMDLLWNGPTAAPHAKILVDRLTAWVMKRSRHRPALIVDGYHLNGTPLGTGNEPTFIGSFAVAAQAAGQPGWLNLTYDHLVRRLDDASHQRYFEVSLGVLYLLTLTGNWPPFAVDP